MTQGEVQDQKWALLQESGKGQVFYWSIQTCSRIMRLIDWLINWLWPCSKTSKLPYFRLFRPDTQILSALTALYWPSTAFYWPNTTKCQPVPPFTDPIPSCINHYRPLLIQYHQAPTSIAPYLPLPFGINQYRLLLTQYHQITDPLSSGKLTSAQYTLGLVSIYSNSSSFSKSFSSYFSSSFSGSFDIFLLIIFL